MPGSVAPSQAGFSSRPIRGIGTLAFNTAGNREESVAFLVNGVSTNNQTFGSLVYEPPLGSIQEFKVDNSAIGAEHGHVSGAIVNLVTRSGTDQVHGDVFEFFRNDALDARNFFEFTTPDPHPFQRNQFGGSLGGPIRRGRTFYFASYEGFRQRQGVDLNSVVLSDAQRAAATDPVIRQLIPLIPRANFFDPDGTPRFVGSAPAVADQDRLDDRRQAQRRPERSLPRLLWESVRPLARTDLAGQQHSRIRLDVGAVEKPADDRRDAHVRIGVPERGALRPDPPRRRHVSGLDRSTRSSSASGTASRSRSDCRR